MLLTVLNSVNVAAAAENERKIPFLVITFINCKLNFRRCNYLCNFPKSRFRGRVGLG